jgi:hypothetical protein
MCFNLVLSKICVFFNKLDRPGPDRLDTYQHYFNPGFIYKLEAQHNCAKLIGRATKATQCGQRYLDKVKILTIDYHSIKSHFIMGQISIICSLSPLAKQNFHYEYSDEERRFIYKID